MVGSAHLIPGQRDSQQVARLSGQRGMIYILAQADLKLSANDEVM